MRRILITLTICIGVLLGTALPCHAELTKVSNRALLKYEDFMTKQISIALGLSGERRFIFEELYNNSVIEAKECRGDDRTQLNIKDLPSMTDVEIEEKIMRTFELSHKLLEIREKYYKKYREIFTAREVAMIYEIERRSRIKFQEELTKRRAEATMEHE